MLTFKKDGIIIRTMKVDDVSSYVSRFNIKDVDYRKELIIRSKRTLKSLKEDDPDMYFIVIKKGTIIGAIVAKGISGSLTDATIDVDIPDASVAEIKGIQELFVEFAREHYFYDNIFFLNQRKIPGRRIPIADSSRWETPK